MNSKEQKIKAEYGEYYEACNPDNQGWSNVDEALGGYEFLDENIEYLDFESSGKWRPKSLQGIENNLGWIKIESEDDLPKEDKKTAVWVIDKQGQIKCDIYHNNWENQTKWFIETFTHYKIIDIPKPPLY
jgi:hypothetical protein